MKFLMKKMVLNAVLAVAGAWLLAAEAHAAFLVINLPGTSEVSNWSGMTAVNYPGYPAYTTSGNSWPSPIAGSGSAGMSLNKTAGLGFPSNGGGIYVGGLTSGTGSFAITDATSLGSLETVVFQIQVSGIGASWTNVIPTLSLNYNGGAQALAWNYSHVDAVAGPIMFGQPSYDYTVSLQWDLSAVVPPISSLGIQWTAAEHSVTSALQVVQGNTMVQVVPEPTTVGLIVLTGLALCLRRRHAASEGRVS